MSIESIIPRRATPVQYPIEEWLLRFASRLRSDVGIFAKVSEIELAITVRSNVRFIYINSQVPLNNSFVSINKPISSFSSQVYEDYRNIEHTQASRYSQHQNNLSFLCIEKFLHIDMSTFFRLNSLCVVSDIVEVILWSRVGAVYEGLVMSLLCL